MTRKDELEKEIKRASELYYNEGQSDLEDFEFDLLVKEYEELTGEKFKSEVSPKKGKKLVDVSHTFPQLVGTLDKAFDLDEFFEWWEDLDVSNKNDILITTKYDGNSVVVVFNDKGELIQALTRGKEGKGLDLTDFFKHVRISGPIVDRMAPTEILGIKCEALITYDNFNKISELEGKSYANPRNLTAGILNSLDGDKYKELVSLAPIDYYYYNKNDSTTYTIGYRIDRLNLLLEAVNDNLLSNSIMLPFESLSEVNMNVMNEIYSRYINNRSGLELMIDGLVIELSDSISRNRLGRSGDRNNYDIALKFPYMTAETTVDDIEWYIGKTGRFTPVAIVKPVYFNGAEITNISLSNIDRFSKLKIYKDCPVSIGYRADVMAYLDVIEDKYNDIEKSKRQYFEIPINCPECGTKLQKNENGTFLFCPNIDCKVNIVGKIVNWFTKLDIKGIKESTVEKLVELMQKDGGKATIERLYELKKEDLTSIEGFKDKMAENTINAIHSKKEIYDYQLFGSLHFENLGIRTSRDIFSKYKFEDITREALLEVDGISNILADSFMKGIESNTNTIEIFMNENPYIKVKSYKDTLGTNNSENSIPKIIVFTGFRDKELQSKIEIKGSKVTSSVSKNTNLVVTKDVNSTSSKIKKARELGIDIMTPEEFKNTYIL